MKTAVFLLAACLAVLAMISRTQGRIPMLNTYQSPRCGLRCPNGYDWSHRCRCLRPNFDPCARMDCEFGMRCVVRRSRGVCIRKIHIESQVCQQPMIMGPCRSAFRRYYYNSMTMSCRQFTYGGCSGNMNNFVSMAACESRCVQRNVWGWGRGRGIGMGMGRGLGGLWK